MNRHDLQDAIHDDHIQHDVYAIYGDHTMICMHLLTFLTCEGKKKKKTFNLSTRKAQHNAKKGFFSFPFDSIEKKHLG